MPELFITLLSSVTKRRKKVRKYLPQVQLNVQSLLPATARQQYAKLEMIKGHSGVRGNERADHIAKSTATQIHNIEYNAIPISQGKQLVRDYYNKIWNATYINSATARHTKVLIPDIPHRLSISLWPNFILTQFLTNHGRFREYLFRMKIAPSPTCDCSERKEQTALHLLKECTLFSRERPAVFNTLPLPQIMKTHIHTTSVMNFLQAVHNKLQE